MTSVNKIINFDVWEFLKSKEALLVHFNAFTQDDKYDGYPDDLTYSIQNKHRIEGKGAPLCATTILKEDFFNNPNGYDDPYGHVGIILKVSSDKVAKVCFTDQGSGTDGMYGLDPTQINCENSIKNRAPKEQNEWTLWEWDVLGIFVLPPFTNFKTTIIDKNLAHHNEIWKTCPLLKPSSITKEPRMISISDVINDFPKFKVYSILNEKFIQLISPSEIIDVKYEDIIK